MLDCAVQGYTVRANKLVSHGLQLVFIANISFEYVECVIPLIFVCYTLVHELPNVVFFPGIDSSWNDSAIVNILLFSTLEVISLVALNVLVQHKFEFSALYQLAYVLETQVDVVEMKFFFAVLSLLPYELEHFGKAFVRNYEWTSVFSLSGFILRQRKFDHDKYQMKSLSSQFG
ncbi:LOW QUALITY PROTEIN: Hypothetical protein PHPALM_7038 [Phytophthora palmivora]|uniref:Uncharacterized protein n=1 Tax=Phytophthora palmivora TaxID=4796 RepID=A0A2P4YDA9_9STRA|nr:LOW QUALITY PROTEIN: Hypothetical protein PHPALM_7038 [Phytophthora palmivora]